MLRKKDGTFYSREVNRTIPDVIYFVVYLGVGDYYHACTMEKLHEHMGLKQRYVNLSLHDFKVLVSATDGESHNYWTIRVEDNTITVE